MAIIKYRDKVTGEWKILSGTSDGDISSSGGGSSGPQIPSDYSQNDSTQPDYIKNRPFYDLRKQSEYTQETGVTPVSFNIPDLGLYFYKISNLALTRDEFLNSSVEAIISGVDLGVIQPKKEKILYDSPNFVVCQNSKYGVTFSFCSRTGKLSGDFNGDPFSCTVPEVGIYIVFDDAVSHLPEGSTIKVSTGHLKTIDEKYIPDNLKLAWTEPAEYSAKMDIHRFDPIYWDGDTSSKVKVNVIINSMPLEFYRVSDKFISYDDVKDAYLGIITSGEAGGIVLDSDFASTFVLKHSDDFMFCPYVFSCAKPLKETVDIEGYETEVAIEYPGTYFLKLNPLVMGESGHISCLIGKVEKTAQDMDVLIPNDDYGFTGFRHICDKIPTKESLVGARFSALMTDESECMPIDTFLTSEQLDEMYYDLESVFGVKDIYGLMLYDTPFAIFISKDNTKCINPDTGMEIVFPKAGTYLLYLDFGYGKYICEVLSFEDTVYKIDPKYLGYADIDGISVVMPGLTGYLLSDSSTAYIYSMTQAMMNGNLLDIVYTQLPNKFILPLTFGSEHSPEDTIQIATGLSTESGSAEITSSVALKLPNCKFKTNDSCLLLVSKNFANNYVSEQLYHIETDLNTASDDSILTAGAIKALGLDKVDTEPKKDSKFTVQSGGVYTALQNVESKIVPADMDEQNPYKSNYVKNRKIYDAPIRPNVYWSSDLYRTGIHFPNVAVDPVSSKTVSYYIPTHESNVNRYLEDISAVSLDPYLPRTEVDLQVIGDPEDPSGYALYSKSANISYPLMVDVRKGDIELNGITFSRTQIGSYYYGRYYIILDKDLSTEACISEILYKTAPSKLSNDYLNIEQTLVEGSKNAISSEAVAESLASTREDIIQQLAVQADMSEQDKDRLSYVKNKLVYDEPLYENLYPGNSYTTTNVGTGVTDITLADGTKRRVNYRFIGNPFGQDLYEKSYTELLKTINKFSIPGIDLQNEVFEVVQQDSTVSYIKGTVFYTCPLLYIASRSGRINNNYIDYPGLYSIDLGTSSVPTIIDTIEFKTAPHKLPSEYLNLDESPTEDSQNPITSSAVYSALKDVQDNLQFDEKPIEGSDNLVNSGALYTAFSDVQKSLEVDDLPIENSDKLVKSGGVYNALKSDIPTKLSQLANDGNYLTERDKDLYIITEENKNTEIPDNFSVILDTTEEDELVDLSEYMRDVPVTDTDNGKFLKVHDGSWKAEPVKFVSYDTQSLSAQEQAQARKNINASEAWTVIQTVDTISAANGLDNLSIIQTSTDKIKEGLVRVCENVYTEAELSNVKVLLHSNAGVVSECRIDKSSIIKLTENNSLLCTIGSIKFNAESYNLHCLVVQEADIAFPLFENCVQNQSLPGTYLSYITSENNIAYLSMEISARVKTPVSEEYLNQFLTKDLLNSPNGIASLNEYGILPKNYLPAELGVQVDWNESNVDALSYINNKPFGEIRYANDIFWDGNFLANNCSSEVNLQPILGKFVQATYVKVSELMTYNKTRPAVLNHDIHQLYWYDSAVHNKSVIELNATTTTYDAGVDGSIVCAKKDAQNNLPIIYFVEHYTSKLFTPEQEIMFPSAGIYVLYIKDVGFVNQITWKTSSIKVIDEQFLPSTFKLPEITEDDEGKILKVVNGKACWVYP